MKLLKRLREEGHVTFGPRWFEVTMYGDNAMHWAVNVWCAGRYWCFRPTTGRGHWRWYFYVSPNATPWAATWGVGPGFRR